MFLAAIEIGNSQHEQTIVIAYLIASHAINKKQLLRLMQGLVVVLGQNTVSKFTFKFVCISCFFLIVCSTISIG